MRQNQRNSQQTWYTSQLLMTSVVLRSI